MADTDDTYSVPLDIVASPKDDKPEPAPAKSK